MIVNQSNCESNFEEDVSRCVHDLTDRWRVMGECAGCSAAHREYADCRPPSVQVRHPPGWPGMYIPCIIAYSELSKTK